MTNESTGALQRLDEIPLFPQVRNPSGQRQSVAIARSIYWNARVTIGRTDCSPGEPNAKSAELVRTLADRIVPVIIISHNMGCLCSR
jgi:ABC-type sugar transport system ATPase subunit